ncbi:MAG TPA: NAD(P)/FAD-dependent oxidoreductase [Thermoanaerobaculia bacterium]|nr:NAD(P)/FAD-dependent oxidoreductase [Thermoanaerobaculia bacterium]
MPDSHAPYDAAIIGGGPAGLTCAIFLARYRRRVVVIDSAEPRNHSSRGIHGFLGYHDITPGELRKRGRAEAESFGAEMRDDRVLAIERAGDLFEVKLAGGATLHARRIALAYGVRDTLPDIPDLASYYGVSVHHCLDCDGYESRDKRMGIIGWQPKVVAVALELLQWTDDVTIFTHGHAREWDAEAQSKLLAETIGIKDEQILALEGEEGRVRNVVLSTGERVPIEALFFNIDVKRACTLAETLGCLVDPKKADVQVDEHGKTTIEGVWAIGDLAKGSQLVVTAAADGAIAAISINKSLLPPSRVL